MVHFVKRKKAYRPKPIHVPMMAETHDRLAMHLLAAVETMIAAPSADAFNELTRKIGAMADAVSYMRGDRNLIDDRDATANALRTSVMVMESIWQRRERTEKVAVSASEALSLRHAARALDDAIATIPKNIFDASMMLVARHA